MEGKVIPHLIFDAVMFIICLWVGLFNGKRLIRGKIMNALQYQRQLAHYNGDQKTVNILDNLIRRTKDA